MSELLVWVSAKVGLKVRLNGWGLPEKKSFFHPKANVGKRFTFCQNIERLKAQNRPIIYIDESGFQDDMPRRYGYAPTSKRAIGSYDWHSKKRTNVIGALLGKALLTVALFTTNINGAIFSTWVVQDLIPKLPPKSVIVMDNATFHKGEDMQQALESEGHTLLYLPSYSPDLNPIENKWAQAKAIRRALKCEIEQLFQHTKI